MKRDWTHRSTLFVAALILVATNLVGLNLFGRLDLTDDRVYSLSDASIDLVEGLDDPVTVTAWFTDDLPAPYSANRRFLKDKLDDYRAYGGSRFQYRFVDPADDPDVQSDAARYGIPPVQIQVIESDNVQLRNVWMGLSIEYGGERETVPVIEDLSTLEYDITSAIRRLARGTLPTVAFLAGHGEPSPESAMPTLQRELSRNYRVTTTSGAGGRFEPRPDALVVMAPTDSLDADALRALDAYVMAGGRVALLVNRIETDLQQGRAWPVSVGLDSLMAGWGMGISENLVMDRQSSAITVQRQQGFFQISQQIEYPFFPIVTRFSQDNPMVSRLRDVLFYFVSSVDTSVVVPAGVDREILAWSTDQAALQEGFFLIQPMGAAFPMEEGPFPLAASYSGTFPSAFEAGRTGLPARVVLVGDGDFLNERIVGAIPGNVDLGLNLVDWLVQDDALLAIRSKRVAPRLLEPVSDAVRPWIKFGTMLGPVLIVLLVGLWRWRRRRARAARWSRSV